MDQPRAYIFDLDGTLVDTVETRIQAWLGAFDEAGIDASHEIVAPLIGSDGRYLTRVVAGGSISEARAEALDHRSGEIYDTLNTDPRPLSGAREVLAALTERGVSWAIATSSRREQVSASVDALRLARPPTIVDGSHVEHAKPAPDLLLLAARELGASPSECRYVGDATWDVRAAVAAEMPAVGITTGAAGAADLAAAGAAITFASLSELLAEL